MCVCVQFTRMYTWATTSLSVQLHFEGEAFSFPGLYSVTHSLSLCSCSVVRKMAQYMADILGDEVKERLAENLLVGPNKLHMENFLTRFQWDAAKFPLRQPLPNIVDGISKV